MASINGPISERNLIATRKVILFLGDHRAAVGKSKAPGHIWSFLGKHSGMVQSEMDLALAEVIDAVWTQSNSQSEMWTAYAAQMRAMAETAKQSNNPYRARTLLKEAGDADAVAGFKTVYERNQAINAAQTGEDQS